MFEDEAKRVVKQYLVKNYYNTVSGLLDIPVYVEWECKTAYGYEMNLKTTIEKLSDYLFYIRYNNVTKMVKMRVYEPIDTVELGIVEKD